MVVVSTGPAPLDLKVVSCWYASDSLLGNQPVVVFIGPSVTTNVTQSSSRIQVHVFTIAGFRSYPRITIDPTSSLYAPVKRLPQDLQGDGRRRGLAVGLYKYYTEIPDAVKQNIMDDWMGTEGGFQPRVFDENHAAALTAKMILVPNAQHVARCISEATAERSMSWVDVDIVLPQDSISIVFPAIPDGRASLMPLPDPRPTVDYGEYSGLLDLLGESIFLPTSRMRRAPSKPTVVSKARVLDKNKEEGLKREIKELLATEENYVSKLQNLLDSAAAREAASSADLDIHRLFPPCLGEIYDLNTELLLRIRTAMDEAPTSRDPTKALAFAKLMHEFFPRFKEPYQTYLRGSESFSKLITKLLRDNTSTHAQAIQATGEQRLRSWLIEPVQRLPRYTMFIDNMANLLPATHPATSRFLAARDVVTDICALEHEGPEDYLRTVLRLKAMIDGLGADIEPFGRLVTAVDCNELEVPYAPDLFGKLGTPCVLLLLPDTVIVVEKLANLSARSIMAEIDRSPTALSVLDSMQGGVTGPKPFAFRFIAPLTDLRLTESYSSRVLNLVRIKTSRAPDKTQKYDVVSLSLQLLGPYENKASKFSEEAAMARVEHRYPEEIRDNGKWALKSAQPQADELGLLCAVSSVGDFAESAKGRGAVGRTRITMDNCLDKLSSKLSSNLSAGVETSVNVSVLEEGRFSLEVLSYGRHVSRDAISEEDFLTCLTRRLGYVQRLHHKPTDKAMAQQCVTHARGLAIVVESLLTDSGPSIPELEPTQSESRRLRPRSPVKGLASLFGSISEKPTSPIKRFGGRSRANTAKTDALPAATATSQQDQQQILRSESIRGQGTLEGYKQAAVQDKSKQLVATFDSYIVALRSRQGNIVGRTLQSRRYADEASINELYNVLIQDPTRYQSAAEVSVDILFASFEKFLHNAWRAQFGEVLPSDILQGMTDLLFSDKPGTVQSFKVMLSAMRVENQQAFTEMITVLSELVNATGNDGDRGVLVATFIEALVPNGSPADHLHLFDKLLDDADMLLGVQPPGPTPDQPDPGRARATGTGSIGSATSSIGKKLGWLGNISRGNSKSGDSETRFARWGKKTNVEPESSTPSLSRSLVSRARSTDTRSTTPGSPSISRPGSSYSSQGQDNSRPGSAHGLMSSLAPIEEKASSRSNASPRKKRRSSFSDIEDSRAATGSSFPAFIPEIAPPRGNHIATSPTRSPERGSPSTRPAMHRRPMSTTMLQRGRPMAFKENTPPVLQESNINRSQSQQSPSKQTSSAFEPLRIRGEKSPTPLSGIPVARGNLPPTLKAPQLSPTKNASQAGSSGRLRVHSPDKLQQRLEVDRTAMVSVGTELQAELIKIGQELAATSIADSTPRAQIARLSSRVEEMGLLLRTRLDELGAQTDTIQRDVESSLIVNERKWRLLDKELREANAENILYLQECNNRIESIQKNTMATKTNGVAELKEAMRSAQDETQKLKLENQKLRRENVGLKAQLK